MSVSYLMFCSKCFSSSCSFFFLFVEYDIICPLIKTLPVPILMPIFLGGNSIKDAHSLCIKVGKLRIFKQRGMELRYWSACGENVWQWIQYLKRGTVVHGHFC